MVRDRFLVTPSACGWQVIHQAETHGSYARHCAAALAAMLLAEIASEGVIHTSVVLKMDGSHAVSLADLPKAELDEGTPQYLFALMIGWIDDRDKV